MKIAGLFILALIATAALAADPATTRTTKDGKDIKEGSGEGLDSSMSKHHKTEDDWNEDTDVKKETSVNRKEDAEYKRTHQGEYSNVDGYQLYTETTHTDNEASTIGVEQIVETKVEYDAEKRQYITTTFIRQIKKDAHEKIAKFKKTIKKQYKTSNVVKIAREYAREKGEDLNESEKSLLNQVARSDYKFGDQFKMKYAVETVRDDSDDGANLENVLRKMIKNVFNHVVSEDEILAWKSSILNRNGQAVNEESGYLIYDIDTNADEVHTVSGWTTRNEALFVTYVSDEKKSRRILFQMMAINLNVSGYFKLGQFSNFNAITIDSLLTRWLWNWVGKDKNPGSDVCKPYDKIIDAVQINRSA